VQVESYANSSVLRQLCTGKNPLLPLEKFFMGGIFFRKYIVFMVAFYAKFGEKISEYAVFCASNLIAKVSRVLSSSIIRILQESNETSEYVAYLGELSPSSSSVTFDTDMFVSSYPYRNLGSFSEINSELHSFQKNSLLICQGIGAGARLERIINFLDFYKKSFSG
jgi:hypothetical protein